MGGIFVPIDKRATDRAGSRIERCPKDLFRTALRPEHLRTPAARNDAQSRRAGITMTRNLTPDLMIIWPLNEQERYPEEWNHALKRGWQADDCAALGQLAGDRFPTDDPEVAGSGIRG